MDLDMLCCADRYGNHHGRKRKPWARRQERDRLAGT